MPKIEKKSAFKPWVPYLTFTELIKTIDLHHKQELQILQDNLDSSRIVIFDGQIIVYRLKKIKIV